MKRCATARLDMSALGTNLDVVRRAAPHSRVLAVIKAQAYGHGMLRVADALHGRVDGFVVSFMEEAEALRSAGHSLPIVVAQGCKSAAELQDAQRLEVDVVVHERSQLRMLETARLVRPLRVWLKFDTGMGRLGFSCDEVPAIFEGLLPNVNCAGAPVLMSHLACADEPERPENARQLERFDAVVAGLPAQRSLANSAGILALPASHHDWVRPGIMIYGASPLEGVSAADLGLRPVMNLLAPVISIRYLKAGDSVGYGASYCCQRPTRLGVIAAGYADGYPRKVPVGTPVLMHGRPVPVIGRVSMDLMAVDLTDAPECHVGDHALLWGEGLPVEEIARAAGTISYDLLCGVADRVQVQVS